MMMMSWRCDDLDISHQNPRIFYIISIFDGKSYLQLSVQISYGGGEWIGVLFLLER